MSRLIVVLGCFVLLALEVNCVKTGKMDEHQDVSKMDVEEPGLQMEDIIKSDTDKIADQEDSNENDPNLVNSKRSYGGYNSASSRYGKLLPSWMTMNHLVDSLVRAHLRGMIVKKLRQEQQAKAELDRMKSDDCSGLVIKGVGKPVIHNTWTVQYGVWIKDPLEYLGPGRIWMMEGYYKNTVKEFASYTDFKAGIVFKIHTLPYHYDGTGAVVYGPFLYYNRYSSKYIVKYDLRNDQMVTQRVFPYYNKVRGYYYQWNGYSGMDLAVDESGLWVMSGYSGYSGRLIVSKIDTTTLNVKHNYNPGGEVQNSMGNAFIACGVVYMVDSYSGSKINYAYDTKTGKKWNPNIPLNWQYNYGTSLDYNPKEKMLYGWDSHEQVTYSLKFGKKI